jgi:hypothetical protein
MTEPAPESDVWLQTLVDRTALLPDPSLRAHWRRVVPWLPPQARYELAAILLDIDHALSA